MSITAVKRDIQAAIDRFPTLTKNGLGFGSMNDGDRAYQFDLSRKEMFTEASVAEFIRASAWLKQVERTKGVSNGWTSYGMKHRAETWAGGYISNGMFIAAAIHLGFVVKQCPWDYSKVNHNPNAYINISVNAVNRIPQGALA